MIVRVAVNFNSGAPSKHLGNSGSETVEGFFSPSFQFPFVSARKKATDLIQ
jgi:hypothetical protein